MEDMLDTKYETVHTAGHFDGDRIWFHTSM